jgi:hypothetical protein
MRSLLIILFLCMAFHPSFSQSAKSKDEVATITDVTRHHTAAEDDASVASYDISLRVGNTSYVVLYTLPPGKLSPEYRSGMRIPVLIGSKTIKFNDMLGQQREVPILRR